MSTTCLKPGFLCLVVALAVSAPVHAQTWTPIVGPPPLIFADPNNTGVGAGEIGGVLYAGTANYLTGAEIWRFGGGNTWTQINQDGFGTRTNPYVDSAGHFNNSLYAGTWNANGTEVWRYDNTGSSWTKVNVNGFGDPNNLTLCEDLIDFNSSLVTATENWITGTEVWRYNNSGTSWTQINVDGFGHPNLETCSLTVFNGELYAASDNYPIAAEIWKYVSGTTWTLVNVPGFGGGICSYGSDFAIYNGSLYVGTSWPCGAAQVWRYNGGTIWTHVNTDGFGNPNNKVIEDLEVDGGMLYVGTGNSVNGGEVWRYNGIGWLKLSTAGFGIPQNPQNKAVLDLVVHAGVLHAVTENDTGAQVWRYTGGTAWSFVGSFAGEEAGLDSYAGQLYVTDDLAIYRAEWTSYCSAKTNSLACVPNIRASGISSATLGSGFLVNGTNFINNKNCLLFYGVNGQASSPFQGGTLCVAPPIKRTPGTNTFGNPPPNDCSGQPSIDMNLYAVGGLGGTPLAALSTPGTLVECQWWGRDPGFAAPNNTQLSNGLEYVVGP